MKKSKSIWENDGGWLSCKGTYLLNIRGSHNIDNSVKERVIQYRNGLFETPKSYDKDGYSYNDGSWLIYNTCRIKDGRYRNKVLCRTKDDVIRYVYDYLCFLRKVGIEERIELLYYVLCYLIDKLAIKENVFPHNKMNLDKLEDLVRSVLNKDVDDVNCLRFDKRKFCMKPDLEDKNVKRQVKVKELNYERIMKMYDPKKTYSQNVFYMKRNGLDVSESTLKRCLKDKKLSI